MKNIQSVSKISDVYPVPGEPQVILVEGNESPLIIDVMKIKGTINMNNLSTPVTTSPTSGCFEFAIGCGGDSSSPSEIISEIFPFIKINGVDLELVKDETYFIKSTRIDSGTLYTQYYIKLDPREYSSKCEIECTVNYVNLLKKDFKLNFIGVDLATIEMPVECWNILKKNPLPSVGFQYSAITSIIIPDGVTSLPYHSFKGCYNLTSVQFPSSITYIDDDEMFYGCRNLKNVTIPSNVKIGSNVFVGAGVANGEGLNINYDGDAAGFPWGGYDNTTLNGKGISNPTPDEGDEEEEEEDPIIPTPTTTLPPAPRPEIVEIPSVVSKDYVIDAVPSYQIWYTTTDGNVLDFENAETFYYEGVEILSNEYVDGKGIITFKGEVTDISGIFDNETEDGDEYVPSDALNTLESVSLPEGLSLISDYAFSNCSNLKRISIPTSVTEISECAFEHTALEKVYLPSVTTLGTGVFTGCEDMVTLYAPELKTIGNHAFTGCTGLLGIEISDNPISISSGAFDTNEGAYTEVRVSEKDFLPNSAQLTGYPYGAVFVGKTDDGLYYDLSTFNCLGVDPRVETLTIPDFVRFTTLSRYSKFSKEYPGISLNNLKEVVISDTVEAIPMVTFKSCPHLEKIYYSGTASLDTFPWGCTNSSVQLIK